MVPVLCGCSMKKAYKKAVPPDMDITEDDTTGNPENVNLVVEAGGTKKWHNGLDDNKLTRMVCKGSILWK